MKKFIMMVVVAMMTAMNVNAQNENLHHELSLSYGLGSIAQFGDGIGEGLALAITSDKEYDDGSIVGPITLEYFYHFNNPRLAVGGSFTYCLLSSTTGLTKTISVFTQRLPQVLVS